MRIPRPITIVAVFVSLAGSRFAVADDAIRFDQKATSLVISAGERPLATYVWQDEKIRRPYFAHLYALDGTQVTRNLPPVAGTDATDHDTMHPGLWMAFGDLSGGDFWRNKGTVAHLEFVEKPSVTDDGGSFAVKNRYSNGDKVICDEICRFRFVVGPRNYLIIWDSQFTSEKDFAFGDQEEMGLGIRLATPLTVKNGGQITNSDGLKNEKQNWGKTADWCDYSGTIDGKPVGVLLVPGPKNFRRSWFHVRDYGLMVANPFGQNAFTQGEKSQRVVHKGEAFRLKFGVAIHSGVSDLSDGYRATMLLLDADNPR